MKEQIKQKSFYFNQIPMMVLLNLRNSGKLNNCLRKCKEVGLTYSTYLKIINKFKELGILNMNKKGRINEITLTENGKEIAGILIKINELLKNG